MPKVTKEHILKKYSFQSVTCVIFSGCKPSYFSSKAILGNKSKQLEWNYICQWGILCSHLFQFIPQSQSVRTILLNAPNSSPSGEQWSRVLCILTNKWVLRCFDAKTTFCVILTQKMYFLIFNYFLFSTSPPPGLLPVLRPL